MYLIQALAEYEKMSDEVVATEDMLREWIFEKKKAEVLLVSEERVEVGFALFFHSFSTFLGRAGIYLEDLFVLPEYRGRGYGKALLKRLAEITEERGCGRLEWACLDWNKPSIEFYMSLGAKPMKTEWSRPWGFWAVPVFPHTSKPGILAREQVPPSTAMRMPSTMSL